MLFNKTIKPLNQFAKKKKEVSVFGATATIFFIIFEKIFSEFFCCYKQVFMNPSFMESIRKRATRFGFILQAIDVNFSQIYRKKLKMWRRDIAINLMLHPSAQD